MRISYFLIAPFILLFSFMSCSGDDDFPTPECDTTTSDFQVLYDGLIVNGYQDGVFYDTEIHEYTFQLSADAQVCAIGYQSQHDDAATPYRIEILALNSLQVVYSEDHVFSGTNTSYVAPLNPINLSANTTYTLRRIQTDWNGDIGNTIGRLALAIQDSIPFPLTSGNLTILGTNFFQNGGPAPDAAVPYIDLVFE